MVHDADVALGIVGMPSYVHSMTAFASMFLTKVAIIYHGHLIERERVHALICSLVEQYKAQPAGKWHLPKMMIAGLERMAETVRPVTLGGVGLGGVGGGGGGGDLGHHQGVGMNENALGLDNIFSGLDCDVLFNYDMNFAMPGAGPAGH